MHNTGQDPTSYKPSFKYAWLSLLLMRIYKSKKKKLG